MTAEDFKKEYHYTLASVSVYSCQYCSRQLRARHPTYGPGYFLLYCGANRGRRFKVGPYNTCDLCIPGIWDAMYECLSGVKHECKGFPKAQQS